MISMPDSLTRRQARNSSFSLAGLHLKAWFNGVFVSRSALEFYERLFGDGTLPNNEDGPDPRLLMRQSVLVLWLVLPEKPALGKMFSNDRSSSHIAVLSGN